MPLYQQIIMAVPKHAPERLRETFQNYTRTVIKHGGVVRAIENFGIRKLPNRITR